MQQPDLHEIRDWVNNKLEAGQEPPWAWFQYMKLRENLDAILESQGATKTENLLQSVSHPEMRLRLVDSTYQQDNAQYHPIDEPPQMPM